MGFGLALNCVCLRRNGTGRAGIVGVCTILVCSMADLVVGVVAIARSGVVGVLRKVAVPVAKRVARA